MIAAGKQMEDASAQRMATPHVRRRCVFGLVVPLITVAVIVAVMLRTPSVNEPVMQAPSPTCATCPRPNNQPCSSPLSKEDSRKESDRPAFDYLNNSFTEGAPPTPPPYVLKIVVFTFNRAAGLTRLMDSLRNAYYPGVDPRSGQLSLTVYVDNAVTSAERAAAPRGWGEKPPSQEVLAVREYLDSFVWPFGSYAVHRREVNTGLMGNILEAWYPTHNGRIAVPATTTASDSDTLPRETINSGTPLHDLKEYAAFFEDDLEVSPYWFVWADRGIRTYSPAFVGLNQENEKLMGLSLYRGHFDGVSRAEVNFAHPDGEPFILQQPSSWGQVLFPHHWRAFRKWRGSLKPRTSVNVLAGSPGSNFWPDKTSWKKGLIKCMFIHGWFMVYPHLPNQSLLSTHHVMNGVHFKGKQALKARSRYNLPLFPPEEMLDAFGGKQMADVVDPRDPLGTSPRQVVDALMRFPPLAEMAPYNLMHQRVKGRGPYRLPNFKSRKLRVGTRRPSLPTTSTALPPPPSADPGFTGASIFTHANNASALATDREVMNVEAVEGDERKASTSGAGPSLATPVSDPLTTAAAPQGPSNATAAALP